VHPGSTESEDPHNDLRVLKGDDSKVFAALVAVLDSYLVKVVHGMVIGTTCISQAPPMAGKLLSLFREGCGVLGTAQSVVLDAGV